MKHIRILSPSGAIDSAHIDNAAIRLRAWGYDVSIGKYARGSYGRFSAKDEERIEDMRVALQDSAVDMILCARGGYGLQRIIDGVAPLYAQHPKTIIGFSDITCLHQLAALNHCPSLHGLMCKHIATLPDDSETLQLFRLSLDGKVSYTIPSHTLNRSGNTEGVIVGGNLSVLYGLQGTPYSIRSVLRYITEHNAHTRPILFLEDVAERHYHIDRMMQNLRLAGIWELIGGLIIGQFSDCQDDSSMGCTIYETIRQSVEGYPFPVMFDFPAGHVDYNLPIWFGKPASLCIANDRCAISVV